ncbi:MAG: DUF1512 family protein [Candidatus Bathyarchaeia archaeon]
MLDMAGQLFQPDNEIGVIIQTLFSVAFIIYLFYAQRIQGMTMLRQIEGTLRKVKHLRDESRRTAIDTVKNIGKPERDPTPMVERFMEHFMIQPVDMDPAGVVGKLGQLLNVRENTFKSEVKMMAPEATDDQVNTLENLLEVALALNIYYKVIRHFYIMGKKTMNIYIIMQIHMILPLLLREIEAHTAALQAFKDGMPIGDSVGAIVAAKLIHGHEYSEVADEMIAAEVPFDGRTMIVAKARGPGGSVGKPGDAIRNLLDKNEGNVRMVITVDAAGKLEGEATGAIAEGIGAAIGGAGVEKYKIEEVANEYKVPLYAVAIKQGIEHVISPIVEDLIDATDKAIESVHRLIHEYSDEGDIILVAGIGNTVGVAQ